MSETWEPWWNNERHQFVQENPEQTGSGSKNHGISSLEAKQQNFQLVNRGRGRNRWQRRGGIHKHRGHSGQGKRGSSHKKKDGGYNSSKGGANLSSHDNNKIQYEGQNIRSGEKEERPWENRPSGLGERRGNYNRWRVRGQGRERNRGRGRGVNTSYCEKFFEGMSESSSETRDYSDSEDESEFEGPTYGWRVRGRARDQNPDGGRGGITGGDFCDERFFGSMSECWSGESEDEDSDWEDESEFKRPVSCPDENEVFEYFIKEVGGPSSLTNIAKSNLFPKDFDISGWFHSHQKKFILFENKGKIHFIIPFYKEATFCFSYNGLNKNKQCDKLDCPHAHVCKNFIGGSCKEGFNCQFSHNFLDGANSGLVYKLGLNTFNNDEIRLIYSHRFPHVCTKHTLEHICRRPVCAYLHICCNSLLGKCEGEPTCSWGHSLRTVQNQSVLKAYNLAHWKEHMIKKMIFTPCSSITDSGNTAGKKSSSHSSKESIPEKADWYQNEHIRVAHGRNNLQEEQKRQSRCRSRSSDVTEGRKRSSSTYSRQRYGQDSTLNLREDHKPRYRSKSRNAAEGHKRSPTPYSRQSCGQDNSLNLKEEQKRQPRCRSKSSDTEGRKRSSTSYSRQRYGHDSTLNLRKEHTPRYRSKSRNAAEGHKRSSTPFSRQSCGQDNSLNLQGEQKRKSRCRSKSRDATEVYKRSSTSDLVLEMDTAQSNPVCDSYIMRQCKTAGCKYHHIDSIKLPYIWQIRMSDKWLTLDKLKMSKIERDYCNKKSTCQIMISYGGSIFNAMFMFPKTDIMTAVITMEGQVPKTISVRRLSTKSYAEETKLSEEASFKTQWRWYYLDDFGIWCLFEPELLQFTLEQKYTRKCQETYLFFRQSFSYQIDFKQMKQTNMDTRKERELLRRPLFVSSDGVESKHYPAMISIPTGANTPFPSDWVPWDLAHKFELVKLQRDSTEFKGVENSFFTTLLRNKMHINNICRVQNMDLWTAYCGQKKSMKGNLERGGQTKNVDERSLFHGTDSLDTVRGICTNCFDFRVCGKNGTVYGKGAYFARDASYSHSYTKSSTVTKERYMFLAKVLVGEHTTGSSSYTRPPNKPGWTGHLLFDSCVDSMNNPSIFVIFDLKQCYPEYLICYTNLEEFPVRETISVSLNKNATPSRVSQHQSTQIHIQSTQGTSRLQRTYSSYNVTASPTPLKRSNSIINNSNSDTVNHPTSLQRTSSSLVKPMSSTSPAPFHKPPLTTRGPSSDTVNHPARLQRTFSSSVKSTSSTSPAPLYNPPSTTRGPSSDTVNNPLSLQRTSSSSSSSVTSTNNASSATLQRPYSVTRSPSSQAVNHEASLPRTSSSSSPSVKSASNASSATLQRPYSVTISPSSHTVNNPNFHTASHGVSTNVDSSQLSARSSYDYSCQMSQGKGYTVEMSSSKKSDCCIL